MKKFFFLLSLFFLNYSHAEIVKDIIVNGNERVNSETIVMFSNIDIGDDVNDDILNNSLKTLFDSNFFEDISISISNSILTINVIENPIIQNLIISGIKSKNLENLILDNISTKPKNPFNENYLENDLN